MEKKVETPELDKMLAVKDKSQAIGSFLDELAEKGIVLCEYKTENDPDSRDYDEDQPEWDGPSGYYTINTPMEKLLAEYFGIDLDKCEEERTKILEALRNS